MITSSLSEKKLPSVANSFSSTKVTISIVGTGNVAFQLGQALCKYGAAIKEIVGRNQEHGNELAKLVSGHYCDTISEMSYADVIIIAVSDDAINIVSQLLPDRVSQASLIVHTSGSVSLSALSRHNSSAVVWPLQTIKKESRFDWSQVPFIITTSADANFQLLENIFSSVSNTIVRMTDEDRSKLHIPAVIVNNFTTYLYGMAAKVCEKEKVDFQLLLPLIQETTDRLSSKVNPLEQLTGPAIRGDVSTINKHKATLSEDDRVRAVYTYISEQILSLHDEGQDHSSTKSTT